VQSVDPTLAEPDLYRRTWTLPLAFSPRDPRALYFGNQKVWRTRDGGAHWDAISPDLTREDPATPANLDTVTAANHQHIGTRRGVVYAIAPSPLEAGLLWAGTDDGLVWRTRDAGAHWDDVTPPALTAWSKVGIIEASHFDADSAYAAVDRHRLDDRKPYIYRTHDGGKTWQLIVTGIRDGDFVNAVREDPQRKGLLYAATELGLYVSFDDGAQWQPLQADLPRTSVRDIDVHGDDLVIATHGRGFWIMDGIAPLRQADAKVAREEAWLYAPATAVRVRVAAFSGTPLPKDEPMASNPPLGAAIDYVLKRAARKPVELTIRDARGAIVRHYSSSDAVPKNDPATSEVAPEWANAAPVLATTAGMHRFTWSLRQAAPAELAEAPGADGVLVPPGNYSVELVVDGRKLQQPLVVAADPRVKVAADAFAAQFAFAREVESAQVRLARAAAEAKVLHAAIAQQRANTAATDAFADDTNALDALVVAAAGLVDAGNPHNAWSLPPNTTTNFRFLGGALGKLAAAAEGADAEPTPDARAGLAALAPKLDRALADWSVLKASRLAPLNERLRKAARKPLPTSKPALSLS
jgi:photosystem II stability/assembly factor-like uncharacterized protein